MRERVYKYKLDFYYKSLIIYFVTLIVYIIVKGNFTHSTFEAGDKRSDHLYNCNFHIVLSVLSYLQIQSEQGR